MFRKIGGSLICLAGIVSFGAIEWAVWLPEGPGRDIVCHGVDAINLTFLVLISITGLLYGIGVFCFGMGILRFEI